jgi:hypothetical protein
MDMPEDQLTHRVEVPGGRPARYTRTRVPTTEGEKEIWGWSPLCYKRVRAHYMHLVDA